MAATLDVTTTLFNEELILSTKGPNVHNRPKSKVGIITLHSEKITLYINCVKNSEELLLCLSYNRLALPCSSTLCLS